MLECAAIIPEIWISDLCRTFIKWWRTLPEERRAYWRSRMLKRQQFFYIAGFGVLTFGIVHYVTHVSETPVTHRRRYLAFTKEQFVKLSEYLYTVVMLCFHLLLLLHVYVHTFLCSQVVNLHPDLFPAENHTLVFQ